MQIYHIPPVPDKSLPTICRGYKCLRDTLKGSNYCDKHQPKVKVISNPPVWHNKFVVYMIKIGGEPYIKVGKASNFTSRLSSIQTGSPKKIEVIAVFHASKDSEKLIHEHLKEYRIRGEWFSEDKVLDVVNNLMVNKGERHKFNLGKLLAISDKIAYS